MQNGNLTGDLCPNFWNGHVYRIARQLIFYFYYIISPTLHHFLSSFSISCEILYSSLSFVINILTAFWFECPFWFELLGLQLTEQAKLIRVTHQRATCGSNTDREARWLENHTHPITYREMIPGPLHLKLVASQVGRKTTFMVSVQRSSLVPMHLIPNVKACILMQCTHIVPPKLSRALQTQ